MAHSCLMIYVCVKYKKISHFEKNFRKLEEEKKRVWKAKQNLLENSDEWRAMSVKYTAPIEEVKGWHI